MSDKIEKEEEPKSNYYNWLVNYEPVEEQDERKLLISAFSGFLSMRNPDYYYNESYLTSYFDDFIEVTDLLKLRVKLLQDLKKSIVHDNSIELFKECSISDVYILIINIDDVVSLQLKVYPIIKDKKLTKKVESLIELNNSLYAKKLSKDYLTISYKCIYSKDGKKYENFKAYDNKINLNDNVLKILSFRKFNEEIEYWIGIFNG